MTEPDAPHTAYWRPVASSAPHRWIALTNDWRVTDRLMRQGATVLGWPDAPAADWLQGPHAWAWWLPVFGRRVLVTAWTDADAHIASLVMPVIEIMKPQRLEYRRYGETDGVGNADATAPAAVRTTLATTQGEPETAHKRAVTSPAGGNETGHAAAA